MARLQSGAKVAPAKQLRGDIDLLERFYSQCEQCPYSDCIVWAGCVAKNGYGKFSLEGKTVLAHRFSIMIRTGRWPGKWYVRHICNNRRCVSPYHLLLGTRSYNEKDKRRKKPPKFREPRHWRYIFVSYNSGRQTK